VAGRAAVLRSLRSSQLPAVPLRVPPAQPRPQRCRDPAVARPVLLAAGHTGRRPGAGDGGDAGAAQGGADQVLLQRGLRRCCGRDRRSHRLLGGGSRRVRSEDMACACRSGRNRHRRCLRGGDGRHRPGPGGHLGWRTVAGGHPHVEHGHGQHRHRAGHPRHDQRDLVVGGAAGGAGTGLRDRLPGIRASCRPTPHADRDLRPDPGDRRHASRRHSRRCPAGAGARAAAGRVRDALAAGAGPLPGGPALGAGGRPRADGCHRRAGVAAEAGRRDR